MNSNTPRNQCLNPYYLGLAGIVNRLKWDLQLESFYSRSKLKKLKDTKSGKKAVIVCNGPSLLKTELNLLNETFTFGLNKINLLFDKSPFRPSCIVAVNKYVIEQNKAFFCETKIPLFLDSKGTKYVKGRHNTIFIHNSSHPIFAEDCSVSVYTGGTVTFVALQLAFHMGFQKVSLIGCDHSFSAKGKPNATVVSEQQDSDHFDDNYFAGGVKWQLPDLAVSEASYRMAMDSYTNNGRIIYNSTEGGKLEVFPRLSLENFLEI